jgi:hypothetical protein
MPLPFSARLMSGPCDPGNPCRAEPGSVPRRGAGRSVRRQRDRPAKAGGGGRNRQHKRPSREREAAGACGGRARRPGDRSGKARHGRVRVRRRELKSEQSCGSRVRRTFCRAGPRVASCSGAARVRSDSPVRLPRPPEARYPNGNSTPFPPTWPSRSKPRSRRPVPARRTDDHHSATNF